MNNDEVYQGMNLTAEVERILSLKEGELTILAYGQTGTGKTHTTTALEGNIAFQLDKPPINIPSTEKLASELFDTIGSPHEAQITVSILEIRGSASYDLLSQPTLQPVKIMVTGVATEYQGLSVHTVSNKSQLLKLIKQGRELRLTRSTAKNDTSSRCASCCTDKVKLGLTIRTSSHSIVQIKIAQKSAEGFVANKATINIVDLAGE